MPEEPLRGWEGSGSDEGQEDQHQGGDDGDQHGALHQPAKVFFCSVVSIEPRSYSAILVPSMRVDPLNSVQYIAATGGVMKQVLCGLVPHPT
jgi:hypothetical protein